MWRQRRDVRVGLHLKHHRSVGVQRILPGRPEPVGHNLGGDTHIHVHANVIGSQRELDTWLVNAAHIKAVRRPKTDVKDSEWIAQLLECGLIRPSFMPPPDIRRLRMLTRYQVQPMGDRTRKVIRLELMLEDAPGRGLSFRRG